MELVLSEQRLQKRTYAYIFIFYLFDISVVGTYIYIINYHIFFFNVDTYDNMT